MTEKIKMEHQSDGTTDLSMENIEEEDDETWSAAADINEQCGEKERESQILKVELVERDSVGVDRIRKERISDLGTERKQTKKETSTNVEVLKHTQSQGKKGEASELVRQRDEAPTELVRKEKESEVKCVSHSQRNERKAKSERYQKEDATMERAKKVRHTVAESHQMELEAEEYLRHEHQRLEFEREDDSQERETTSVIEEQTKNYKKMKRIKKESVDPDEMETEERVVQRPNDWQEKERTRFDAGNDEVFEQIERHVPEAYVNLIKTGTPLRRSTIIMYGSRVTWLFGNGFIHTELMTREQQLMFEEDDREHNPNEEDQMRKGVDTRKKKPKICECTQNQEEFNLNEIRSKAIENAKRFWIHSEYAKPSFVSSSTDEEGTVNEARVPYCPIPWLKSGKNKKGRSDRTASKAHFKKEKKKENDRRNAALRTPTEASYTIFGVGIPPCDRIRIATKNCSTCHNRLPTYFKITAFRPNTYSDDSARACGSTPKGVSWQMLTTFWRSCKPVEKFIMGDHFDYNEDPKLTFEQYHQKYRKLFPNLVSRDSKKFAKTMGANPKYFAHMFRSKSFRLKPEDLNSKIVVIDAPSNSYRHMKPEEECDWDKELEAQIDGEPSGESMVPQKQKEKKDTYLSEVVFDSNEAPSESVLSIPKTTKETENEPDATRETSFAVVMEESTETARDGQIEKETERVENQPTMHIYQEDELLNDSAGEEEIVTEQENNLYLSDVSIEDSNGEPLDSDFHDEIGEISLSPIATYELNYKEKSLTPDVLRMSSSPEAQYGEITRFDEDELLRSLSPTNSLPPNAIPTTSGLINDMNLDLESIGIEDYGNNLGSVSPATMGLLNSMESAQVESEHVQFTEDDLLGEYGQLEVTQDSTAPALKAPEKTEVKRGRGRGKKTAVANSDQQEISNTSIGRRLMNRRRNDEMIDSDKEEPIQEFVIPKEENMETTVSSVAPSLRRPGKRGRRPQTASVSEADVAVVPEDGPPAIKKPARRGRGHRNEPNSTEQEMQLAQEAAPEAALETLQVRDNDLLLEVNPEEANEHEEEEDVKKPVTRKRARNEDAPFLPANATRKKRHFLSKNNPAPRIRRGDVDQPSTSAAPARLTGVVTKDVDHGDGVSENFKKLPKATQKLIEGLEAPEKKNGETEEGAASEKEKEIKEEPADESEWVLPDPILPHSRQSRKRVRLEKEQQILQDLKQENCPDDECQVHSANCNTIKQEVDDPGYQVYAVKINCTPVAVEPETPPMKIIDPSWSEKPTQCSIVIQPIWEFVNQVFTTDPAKASKLMMKIAKDSERTGRVFKYSAIVEDRMSEFDPEFLAHLTSSPRELTPEDRSYSDYYTFSLAFRTRASPTLNSHKITPFNLHQVIVQIMDTRKRLAENSKSAGFLEDIKDALDATESILLGQYIDFCMKMASLSEISWVQAAHVHRRLEMIYYGWQMFLFNGGFFRLLLSLNREDVKPIDDRFRSFCVEYLQDIESNYSKAKEIALMTDSELFEKMREDAEVSSEDIQTLDNDMICVDNPGSSHSHACVVCGILDRHTYFSSSDNKDIHQTLHANNVCCEDCFEDFNPVTYIFHKMCEHNGVLH